VTKCFVKYWLQAKFQMKWEDKVYDYVWSSELRTKPEYKDSWWIICKCGNIQILGEDANKSEWHTWRNQKYIKLRECLLLFSTKSLYSRLISKNLKIKIYRTVILPVVLYGCETWSLTLRKEHRLRVFKKRVLRRIFGTKREEDGSWRKMWHPTTNFMQTRSVISKTGGRTHVQ
jgi:hypothetical protein